MLAVSRTEVYTAPIPILTSSICSSQAPVSKQFMWAVHTTSILCTIYPYNFCFSLCDFWSSFKRPSLSANGILLVWMPTNCALHLTDLYILYKITELYFHESRRIQCNRMPKQYTSNGSFRATDVQKQIYGHSNSTTIVNRPICIYVWYTK